ncbi:tetratricopeptide repeat protein [bacterium]|nr:tetratricopeptide repeat protein [bacterium]
MKNSFFKIIGFVFVSQAIVFSQENTENPIVADNVETTIQTNPTKLDSLTLSKLVRLRVKLREELESLQSQKDSLAEVSYKNLDNFLSLNADTKYKEDVLIRLAEVTIQKEKEDNFLKQEEYTKRVLADPNYDEPFPKDSYAKSIGLLNRFVTEYPNSKYLDKTYYNLAFLNNKTGNTEIAKTYNEKILKSFPESDYFVEALMALGNYYFEPPKEGNYEDTEARIRKAITYYKQVLEFRDSRRYAEALYRLGWSNYKLVLLPEAVGYFTNLLDDIEKYKTYPNRLSRDRKLSVTNPDFYEDALTYLAISFTNDSTRTERGGKKAFAYKGPDGAKSYLEGIQRQFAEKDWKPYGADIFLKIGSEYQKAGQGHQENALKSYTYLLDHYPLYNKAPIVHRNIISIEALKEPQDKESLYAAKKGFYDKYVNESAAWVVHFKDKEDPEVLKERLKIGEQYLAENVSAATLLVNKEPSQAANELLVQATHDYLAAFPNGYRAPLFQQYIGITLKELGKTDEAFDTLFVMAAKFKDTEDIKYYASIEDWDTNNFIFFSVDSLRYLATKNSVAYAQEMVKEVPPTVVLADSTTPDSVRFAQTELAPQELKLVKAIDNLIAYFPEDSLVAPLTWDLGLLNFNRNRYPDAIAKFETLIKSFPNDKNVVGAEKNIIESYFRMGQFDVSAERSRALLSLGVLNKEDSSAVLQRLAIANIKGAKNETNYIVSAERLLRTVQDYPNYDKIGLVIMNAAEQYRLAAENDSSKADSLYKKVIDTYDILINRYPKLEETKVAHQNKAYIYQDRLKNYLASAETYENFYKTYPTDEKASGFLIEARANYEKLQDWKSAIRVSDTFVNGFPNDERANPVLFATAEFYLKLDDVESANKIYEDFAAKFPDDALTVKAFYDRGIYFKEKRSDYTKSLDEFQKAVERNKQLEAKGLPSNPYWAGEALYEITEKELQDYLVFEMKNAGSVKSDIERKIKLRDGLAEKYAYLAGLSVRRYPKAAYSLVLIEENFAENYASQAIPDNNAVKKVSVSRESYDIFSACVKRYEETLLTLNEFMNKSREGRTQQLATIDTTSVEQMKAIAVIDSGLVDAENIIGKIQVRLPRILFNTAEINYQTVETFLQYGDIAKELETSKKRNKFVAYVAKKDAYINTPDKNFGIKPVADQIISLHLKNLNTLDSLGISNEWNTKSKDRIVQISQIAPQEYSKVTNECLSEVEREIALYKSSLESIKKASSNIPQAIFEVPVYIPIYLKLSSDNSLQVFENYKAYLTVYQNASINTSASRQAEESMSQTGYELGQKYLKLAESFRNEKKYCDQKYLETDLVEWSDAALNFSDWEIQLTDLAKTSLQNTYQVQADLSLATNPYTGKIIKELITISPAEFKSLINVEEKSQLVATNLTDWLVSSVYTEGYSRLNFDDSSWKQVSAGTQWSQELQFPTAEEGATLPKSLWNESTNIWKKIKSKQVLFDTTLVARNVDTLLTIVNLVPREQVTTVPDTVWTSGTASSWSYSTRTITDSVKISDAVWEKNETTQTVPDTVWADGTAGSWSYSTRTITDSVKVSDAVWEKSETVLTDSLFNETENIWEYSTKVVVDSVQISEPKWEISEKQVTDSSFVEGSERSFTVNFVEKVVVDSVQISEPKWEISEKQVTDSSFVEGSGEGSFTVNMLEKTVTVYDSVTTTVDSSFVIYDKVITEQKFEEESEDASGENAAYFRTKFFVDGIVTSAKLLMTGDDNLSIYVNGETGRYDQTELFNVAGEDSLDWNLVNEVDITQSMKSGENILSTYVTDLDSSSHGFQLVLEIKTIPELSSSAIESQIESTSSSSTTEEGATPITPEQERVLIRRNLIFDKNRLP